MFANDLSIFGQRFTSQTPTNICIHLLRNTKDVKALFFGLWNLLRSILSHIMKHASLLGLPPGHILSLSFASALLCWFLLTGSRSQRDAPGQSALPAQGLL